MDKLHSAVNKAVATISNCDEEPIHIPGTIQPHGFFIGIEVNTGIIEMCSENIADFLLLTPLQFLSRHYGEVLPTELHRLVTNHLEIINNDTQHIPVPALINEMPFDCFRRSSANYFYLECILALVNPYSVYDIFLHNNDLLKITDSTTNLYQLCNSVVQKIRLMTDYDRVMLYRFDEHYNGHVYAESTSEGTDSFLGLHYPHTDIPKQARELYLKNLMRSIPDVNYTPVPIVTYRPGLAEPGNIDLSNVNLRSVSPIHITYLKNMRVGATLTISLINDGKLWGLIACHHNEAKQISYIKQTQAYLLSQILSSQIGVRETAEKYLLSQQLEVPLNKLMAYLQREENFLALHFEHLTEMLSVVNATGAALIHKNKIYTNGITPPEAFLLSLHDWLIGQGKTFFHSDELRIVFPEAVGYMDIASGLLYVQLTESGQPSLFWFRSSVNKVISWAGNPYQQQQESPLSPRKSFAAWKELKQGSSEPWQQPELDAAFRTSYLLQRHIFQMHQREEEIRYRKLNEQLLRANKELENINWISTHDLKEPLRKIQIFASLINSSDNSVNVESLRKSVDRIRASASRMQGFIDDLLLYSKMSDSDFTFEMLNLNDVLNEVLNEFEEEKTLNYFELYSDLLPNIVASQLQIKQLFINLIGNAIKFRKKDLLQTIKVSYEQLTDENISNNKNSNWHKITISDTGVGFIMEMAEAIFDIFKRAHSQEQYKGSGMGLSICRKIMENHGGKITGKGKENEGAEFTLYFPASNSETAIP